MGDVSGEPDEPSFLVLGPKINGAKRKSQHKHTYLRKGTRLRGDLDRGDRVERGDFTLLAERLGEEDGAIRFELEPPPLTLARFFSVTNEVRLR